jgi:hypothetical protein
MPSQPSPCACSNTASRQEIILFNFVQGAGLNPSARSTSLFRLSPGVSGYRKLPLECSQFEEALTLAEESLSTTTECESCALIRPERAQSKQPQNQAFVRHTITLQASEFLRFRCEISMWRKNCPSRLEGISKRVSRRVIGDVPFAQHGHNIPLLLRVLVKHLVGIGVLVAIAFVLRFWLRTSLGLDISIHDTYRVVPLWAILFWCLMGTAIIWFLIFCFGGNSSPFLISPSRIREIGPGQPDRCGVPY